MAGGLESSRGATLVIVVPERDTAGAVPPETVLLGLPLIRRAVLAAERAGFDHTLVLAEADDGALGRALDGTWAARLGPGDSLPALPPGRLLILSATVLPSVAWLRSLRAAPAEAERIYVDAPAGVPAVALIETCRPEVVTAAFTKPGPIAAGLARLGPEFETAPRRLRDTGVFELWSAADLPGAEAWLLARLVKETDGFMARHVDRRISLALSRRLASTRLTPTGMTLLHVGVGLCGAGFFLSSRPSAQFAGAALILLHSILDGCDGELARLKFQESRRGGILDFWGDNVVHAVMFACMAMGLSHAQQASWPLLVGAVAILGTLASASLVYRETMRRPREGPIFTSVSSGPETPVSRMADAVARRDFLYLVLVLAALGKASWFVVLGAIGAPTFFLVLLGLSRAGRRRAVGTGSRG